MLDFESSGKLDYVLSKYLGSGDYELTQSDWSFTLKAEVDLGTTVINSFGRWGFGGMRKRGAEAVLYFELATF